MSTLHAIGALAVFVTLAGGALAAAGAALAGGGAWVECIRAVVMAVLVVDVAIGAATYLAGDRPAEPLHILYGALVLGVLPLAASFAADAPPRPRAWVIAGALGVLLILFSRLAATG